MTKYCDQLDKMVFFIKQEMFKVFAYTVNACCLRALKITFYSNNFGYCNWCKRNTISFFCGWNCMTIFAWKLIYIVVTHLQLGNETLPFSVRFHYTFVKGNDFTCIYITLSFYPVYEAIIFLLEFTIHFQLTSKENFKV